MLFGHSASRLTNIIHLIPIPLTVLSAYFLNNFMIKNNWIMYIFVFTLFLAGSYNISAVINPQAVFYSPADERAFTWIQKNLPAESNILINSYPWAEGYGPADGGGWLRYLTAHETIYPKTVDEYANIVDFVYQSQIDYIYLGSGFGELTPGNMNRIPSSLVYGQDGIYIYKVFAP
jgi:hypothetical protein